jgi:hypothetical protein
MDSFAQEDLLHLKDLGLAKQDITARQQYLPLSVPKVIIVLGLQTQNRLNANLELIQTLPEAVLVDCVK